MSYDAFISYSHGNDAELAEQLQRGLRRFAKPLFRRHALRVFRDSTGLSANPALWGSIKSAMDESDYLVLLCSPEAAASPWVGREIGHWIDTHPAETILPVLADGTLVWDDGTGRFDPTRSTAAHPMLARAFTEEPLYLDLRWARTEDQISLSNPGFRDQIAALASTLHGRPKDEMIGEDIRQHRRTLRVAWAAGVALLLLTIGTIAGSSIAVTKSNEAEAKSKEAQRSLEAQIRVEGELDDVNATLKTRQAELKERQAQLTETNTRLETAESGLAVAETEAEGARAEADTAKGEAQAAGAQRDTAKADATKQATLATAAEAQRQVADQARAVALAAELQARADALVAQGQKDEAVTQANVARAQAEQADQQRQIAAEEARVAGIARDEATTQRDDATVARDAAITVRNEAITARDEANAARDAANLDKAAAEAAKAKADLARRATDLEVASTDTLSAAPDLSLLLASEAAQLGGLESTGALHQALATTERVRGFFKFDLTIRPEEMTKVAVSQDSHSVAAAEHFPFLDQPFDRLWFWPDDNGTFSMIPTARPTTTCVTHMTWLDGDHLMTVEAPLCKPTLVTTVSGIAYGRSTLTIWSKNGTPIPGQSYQALARIGAPPVATSADGHHLAFAIVNDAVAVPPGVLPMTKTVLMSSDGGTLHTQVVPSTVPHGFFFGSTLSPSGRYAALEGTAEVVNELTSAIALVDLSQWGTVGCVPGCFDHTTGVAPGTDPSFGTHAVGWSGDELTVAFSAVVNPGGAALHVFDVATGAEQTARRHCTAAVACGPDGETDLPGRVQAIALTDDRLVVAAGPAGGVDVRQLVPPLAEPLVANSACAPEGLATFADEALLIVTQRCALGSSSTLSSLVFDLDPGESPSRRGELTGEVRFVTNVLTPAPQFQLEQLVVTESSSGGLNQISHLWELPPGGGVRLADIREGRAVRSLDRTIVAVGQVPTATSAAPVAVWRLKAGITTASLLGGSTGTVALGFGHGHELVGFGSQAPAQWGLDKTAAATAYDLSNQPECAFAAPAANGGHALTTDRQSISLEGPGDTVQIALPQLPAGSLIESMQLTPDDKYLLVNFTEVSNVCRFPGFTDKPITGSVVISVNGTATGWSAAPVVSPLQTAQVLAASGDGLRLLFRSLADSALVVRDTSTLVLVRSIDRAGNIDTNANAVASSYAIDKTGQRVAAFGPNLDKAVLVWSVQDGQLVRALPYVSIVPSALEKIHGIGLSPDGTELAVATTKRVVLLDLTTGTIRRNHGSIRDNRTHVTYSPDGSMLVVDGARLFSTATLRQLGGRIGPDAWEAFDVHIRDVVRSHFVTGANGVLQLVVERQDARADARWRIDAAGLLAQACGRVGRNLTPGEAATYDVPTLLHLTCLSFG